MSIEAMKMALEALEMTQVVFEAEGKDYGLSRVSSAINTLRQAIEQSEKQEPFILDRGCYQRGCVAYDERDGDGVIIKQERVDETAKREHEPVAWMCSDEMVRKGLTRTSAAKDEIWNIPLYTAPPKREWVDLADEVVEKIAEYHGIDSLYETGIIEFYRAISVTLKEKNT